MLINFYKYQGTGNDFVVIDDRKKEFPIDNQALVAKLCDRRFGVGGDGLMLLQNFENSDTQTDTKIDFQMFYFNADGNQSSMCGNGGRCMVAFAQFLGIISNETTFSAIDGLHDASIENGLISLKMNEVHTVETGENYYFLNTGSPHYVRYVQDIMNYQVFEEGKKIRYSKAYEPKGTNVNFIEELDKNYIYVRTYERGVEDETFSCGTGVTAAAIVHTITQNKKTTHQINTKNQTIKIKTLGGNLSVSFDVENNKYTNIYLTGEAKQVFEGSISISL
jgi:diaminopimelate epimerase